MNPWTSRLAAVCALATLTLAWSVPAMAQTGDDFDGDEPVDRGDSPPPDESNIAYADSSDPRQTLDVYQPAEPGESRPAVVFIHGGGFRRGTKNTFRLEGDLARDRGWVGFSINYRLDADPGHPTEMNDVLTAVEWVRDHADEYGVDPARIALYGTSAGGNLAALAAANPAGPLTTGNRVVGVVAFSGPMDMAIVHESRFDDTIEDYLGCDPSGCPDLYADASATTHVDADDPAMFLAHSANEGVPVEATEKLAELLDDVGVFVELEIVPGGLHARSLSLRTPGLMDSAFDFLDARFAEATDPTVTSAPDPESDGGDTDDTDASTTTTENPVPSAPAEDSEIAAETGAGTESSSSTVLWIVATAAAVAGAIGLGAFSRRSRR